jgi:hypothetical protein
MNTSSSNSSSRSIPKVPQGSTRLPNLGRLSPKREVGNTWETSISSCVSGDLRRHSSGQNNALMLTVGDDRRCLYHVLQLANSWEYLGEDGMIWWTKTGFGYTAVCEVRSRHWLVIGQCGETLVNTRFCAEPRSNVFGTEIPS